MPPKEKKRKLEGTPPQHNQEQIVGEILNFLNEKRNEISESTLSTNDTVLLSLLERLESAAPNEENTNTVKMKVSDEMVPKLMGYERCTWQCIEFETQTKMRMERDDSDNAIIEFCGSEKNAKRAKDFTAHLCSVYQTAFSELTNGKFSPANYAEQIPLLQTSSSVTSSLTETTTDSYQSFTSLTTSSLSSPSEISHLSPDEIREPRVGTIPAILLYDLQKVFNTTSNIETIEHNLDILKIQIKNHNSSIYLEEIQKQLAGNHTISPTIRAKIGQCLALYTRYQDQNREIKSLMLKFEELDLKAANDKFDLFRKLEKRT